MSSDFKYFQEVSTVKKFQLSFDVAIGVVVRSNVRTSTWYHAGRTAATYTEFQSSTVLCNTVLVPSTVKPGGEKLVACSLKEKIQTFVRCLFWVLE